MTASTFLTPLAACLSVGVSRSSGWHPAPPRRSGAPRSPAPGFVGKGRCRRTPLILRAPATTCAVTVPARAFRILLRYLRDAGCLQGARYGVPLSWCRGAAGGALSAGGALTADFTEQAGDAGAAGVAVAAGAPVPPPTAAPLTIPVPVPVAPVAPCVPAGLTPVAPAAANVATGAGAEKLLPKRQSGSRQMLGAGAGARAGEANQMVAAVVAIPVLR